MSKIAICNYPKRFSNADMLSKTYIFLSLICRSENFMDMQCMLQTSPTTVLFGGHQEYLVEYDLAQSMELRTVINK